MGLNSLYERKLAEKAKRSRKLKKDLKKCKTQDVWSEQKNKRTLNSLKEMHLKHKSPQVQPKLERQRTFSPKNGVHLSVEEYNPVFHEVPIVYSRLGNVQHLMKRPSSTSSSNNLKNKDTQIFYFLLEPMPNKVLELLHEQGILSKEQGHHSEVPFKVGFSDWDGYYTNGKYYVNAQVCHGLSDGEEFRVSKKLAEQLYQSCEDDPEARARLRLFGLYHSELETVVQGDNADSQVLGLSNEEMQEAHLRFCALEKNHRITPATILRARDLRSRKIRRWRTEDGKLQTAPKTKRTRKPYSWRQGGIQTGGRSEKEPGDTDKKTKAKKVKLQNLAESEKYVSDIPSLYRACAYIFSGRSKSQGFKTHNQKVRDPLKVILGYIQSRTDRGLCIDIDEVLAMKHPVVNYRLSKWESENNKRIKSIPDLLRGRFFKRAKKEKENYQGTDQDSSDDGEGVLITRGEEIKVSSGYFKNPNKYVTTGTELLSAVRRVLTREIDVSGFHILDPRTRVILEYAQESSELSNGDISPRQIANLTAPGLKKTLERRGLLDYHPRFSYQ